MMFLSSDAVASDLPKLGAVSLQVGKEDALRLTQELFLEGRQINALYICTHEELKTADKRKLSWIASAHNLFEKIVDGHEAIDFFDEIAISVLRETDPIETLSEQFHNELNQRLERLRMVRRVIENSTDVVNASAASAKRPAAPTPQPTPQPVPPAADPAAPTGEGSGVSSLPSDIVESAAATKPAPSKPAVAVTKAPSAVRTKILLVLCSRNGTARQALCRFANQMNLSFEIVDYNPDSPSRIAEQIYHHRDAGFAVVYWGEPAGRELPGSAHPERYVGFALGFALGRLGRGRVFVMGSTTTPPLPGFTRVLVSQLDSGGGWQIQLARRMKAAGVDIDLNLLT